MVTGPKVVPVGQNVQHANLVAEYDNYPEEHVDAEVALFARKSGNPAIAELVASFDRPYTRNHLKQVLAIASVEEIEHVGW